MEANQRRPSASRADPRHSSHECRLRQPYGASALFHDIGTAAAAARSRARELLASGYPATAVIAMKHAGSGVEALRSTVGAAARLTVENNEQGRPIFRQLRGPQTRGAPPPLLAEGGAP